MTSTARQAIDPLELGGTAERVNYATGTLLDAQDFRDEQTYHRARLATALRHLVGFGTVAGLRVRPPEDGDGELELRVDPGVAIDRLGRLIEVRVPQCIRLARWVGGQETALLRSILRRDPRTELVADVFLGVQSCARGKTPAFATGPFDSLDAVAPSRLAEMPALELVPRAEAGAAIPVPQNFWPAPDASINDRLAAVLGSWEDGAGERSDRPLDPLAEHVVGHDPAAMLLARVTIPVDLAADAAADVRPRLDLTQATAIDNSVRPFIFLPGKWLGRAVEL